MVSTHQVAGSTPAGGTTLHVVANVPFGVYEGFMKEAPHVIASWTDKTSNWVKAGLISSDQAEAITTFEAGPVVPSNASPGIYEGELSPLAEALAYLAMIFTVASGASLVMHSFREDLPRTLALALAAIVGLALGQRLIRMGGHSWDRIGGVLSAFGTLCATGLVGFVLTKYAEVRGAHVALIAGIFLFLLSVALWQNRDRFFQFVTAVGGFYLTVVAIFQELNWHPRVALAALIVWASGLLLVLLRSRLRPSYGVLFVGMVVALSAAPVTGEWSQLGGALLGLATAGLGVWLALPQRNIGVLLASAIATFGNLIHLFALYVHSSAALAVVFLVSATFIVVLVIRYVQGHTVVRPDAVVTELPSEN